MIRILLGTALLCCAAAGQDVLLGIDVLQKLGCQPLAGKEIGLVTNHTGRDRQGRRTVDVLHDSEIVELRLLFSPEHGWQGALDQAQVDVACPDERTKLPQRIERREHYPACERWN